MNDYVMKAFKYGWIPVGLSAVGIPLYALSQYELTTCPPEGRCTILDPNWYMITTPVLAFVVLCWAAGLIAWKLDQNRELRTDQIDHEADRLRGKIDRLETLQKEVEELTNNAETAGDKIQETLDDFLENGRRFYNMMDQFERLQTYEETLAELKEAEKAGDGTRIAQIVREADIQ